MILNKGQLVYFSDGEYSDYIIRGHFVVLKSFDTSIESLRDIVFNTDISEDLREDLLLGAIYISFNVSELLNILIKLGYIEEIEIQEVFNLIPIRDS